MKHYINAILQRWKQRQHARTAAAILNTPPIKPHDDGVILFSMIGTRVVLPYLVAVKSMHAALGRGRIVILDDGSLNDADRAVLAQHLGNPKIIHIKDVDTTGFPSGCVWERLLALLDLRTNDYVIQLDSDTVTIGDVPEVRAAIEQGHSFTLRGDVQAEFLPVRQNMDTAVQSYIVPPGVHVQRAIEEGMEYLDLSTVTAPRYVRGCAGFAGFAPHRDGRESAATFSREATRLLGREKWGEWGSEQVTSNFVVANEADAVLLPYDRYLNFWNEAVPDDARFLHFVGTHRYSGTAYADATRQAIAHLQAVSR